MDKKVYYYSDELNDDFAEKSIEPIKIDENYKYVHKNIFWKIGSFIVYRLIALPIAFVYSKCVHKLKVVGKEKLKEAKGSGYFTYQNHTQVILDTLMPTLINFPRKAHIVAHPDNVSIPILGGFNKMMGGFPIPSDIKTTKNFLSAMEYFLSKKNVIAVYPEAHVWPYYTKIRSFVNTSFKYPVKYNVPAYAYTTTYKDRPGKKPQIVVYIDGPFYADDNLSTKKAEQDLRDKVYNAMANRAKNSNVEYCKYIKIEDDKEDLHD